MRSIRWLAIFICMAQVVAACGPTQSQSSTATSAPAATTAPAAGAPTQAARAANQPAGAAVPSGNLRLMGWSSSPEEDRLLNDTLTEFSKQYPSIQVTFVSVILREEQPKDP